MSEQIIFFHLTFRILHRCSKITKWKNQNKRLFEHEGRTNDILLHFPVKKNLTFFHIVIVYENG